MPIDGLVSGLDTATIVKQLMDLERIPRDLMAKRVVSAQTALDSLKSVEASAAKVKVAAGLLQRVGGWDARVARSSDPSVASVSATSSASVAAFSFTVDGLARGHGVATMTAVGGPDTVVAGSSITVTQGSTVTNVAVGGGTLAEVASAISAAGLGVRAAAVNTGSGYRLQVDSTSTGLASQFGVSGLDVSTGGTAVTSQGADARLMFGSGPGAYSVSSSSNTFASIVPGVTVVARALSSTPVVVDVSVDSAALADKVSGLVDAVNATLTEIAARTAFDPATKKSASLTGNVSVRRLGQELTHAVLSTVSQSALSAPGLAGVSTDRYGKITFDRAKFLAAFEKDPTAVRRLFVQGATATGTVSFVGATDDTRVGTASVSVTSVAAAGTILGVPAAWGDGATTPIVVRRGSSTVSVSISAAETAADARTALAAAIDAAGLGINVSVESGQLRFTAAAVGSASSFEVAWDGTGFNAAPGADVAGTINGVAAIGTGNLLLAAVGTPGVVGLTVQTDGTTLGPVGTLDYEPGVAQRLTQVLSDSTTPTTGYLTAAEKNRQTRIESLNTTIDAYDRRLAKRETALKAQYSALEVALGKLKSQGNFLTSQIASTTNRNG